VASGGALTELRVEVPPGTPRDEFLAAFAAELGLEPAQRPARGMAGFELMVMQADDDLEGRAERTGEHGERTFDMMRRRYRCEACGDDSPKLGALILTRSPYRSIAEISAALPGLVRASERAGHGPEPCSCGAIPVIACAEHFGFGALTKRDLVVRWTPDDGLTLWDWSSDAGFQRRMRDDDIDRGVARGCIVRTLAALREQMDETNDLDSLADVLREGIDTTPENADLLDHAPFLMAHAGSKLVDALATAHVAAAPNSPVGHYWKGQVLLDAAFVGSADASAVSRAEAFFARAVELEPDDPDALIGLANVARFEKDDARAEALLRTLLDRHPQHPEANYTLGLLLLPRAPGEALCCFERGQEAAPQDPDYPRGRARALLALRRLEEADTAIKAACKLAPDDARVAEVANRIEGARRAEGWRR
jgi:hypothetical protein